jgi:hypothetical protein
MRATMRGIELEHRPSNNSLRSEKRRTRAGGLPGCPLRRAASASAHRPLSTTSRATFARFWQLSLPSPRPCLLVFPRPRPFADWTQGGQGFAGPVLPANSPAGWQPFPRLHKVLSLPPGLYELSLRRMFASGSRVAGRCQLGSSTVRAWFGWRGADCRPLAEALCSPGRVQLRCSFLVLWLSERPWRCSGAPRPWSSVNLSLLPCAHGPHIAWSSVGLGEEIPEWGHGSRW